MNTISFTTQALAIVDNLKPVEKILEYDEFLLLINISSIFDKAQKSELGLLFVKAYLYTKVKECEKKDIIVPALKDYILNPLNKDEKKQIDMIDNTVKFMEKLTELALLVKEQPELANILSLFTEGDKKQSPFSTSPN